MHIDRALREVREEGPDSFQHGKVAIHDRQALALPVDFGKRHLDRDGPLLV